MKRVVFCICCLFLLVGCWDRRELKELGIVVAIGIDKDPDTGDIVFTSQVLNPSALKPEGGGTEAPVTLITTKGDTVFKAIRNAQQEFDRKNFYAHNKVVVIGEHLAREGILPVLDGITRGREARGYVWLCVTKDRQAKDILGVKKHGVENVQANYLERILENQQFNFDTTVLQLNDYYKKSLKGGIHPVTGALEMMEKSNSPVEEMSEKTSQHVKLSGGAVFKEDKLVGFLSETEARGYNWIVGEVKSGVLSLPSLLEEEKLVSIEIREASSKIKPEIQGDEVSFNIEIESSGALVEQQGAGALETRKEQLDYLKRLEKELEKLIEREVDNIIEKAQKELKTDIFGFGSTLNRKDPKKWNQVKDQWEDQFQNAGVKVRVHANIDTRELLKEPLKSKN
ncbi:Ger(x)C family spore germination protein [Priestia abyssalis]|uniref:Ger(x)C family spore germination protein n=1 Tax=Priestia abyssalis TaxID=1221450 RepID=UPI000995DC5E|nr:Ger(x)C family spore germination protein [Priestia abyssalis]